MGIFTNRAHGPSGKLDWKTKKSAFPLISIAVCLGPRTKAKRDRAWCKKKGCNNEKTSLPPSMEIVHVLKKIKIKKGPVCPGLYPQEPQKSSRQLCQ